MFDFKLDPESPFKFMAMDKLVELGIPRKVVEEGVKRAEEIVMRVSFELTNDLDGECSTENSLATAMAAFLLYAKTQDLIPIAQMLITAIAIESREEPQHDRD